MKIVHVMWGAGYGGTETMLVEILNLQVQFHEIELLIINDFVEESLIQCFDSRIRIRRINRPVGSHNPWYIFQLNRILWNSRADVVHFHQDNIIRYVPIRKWMKNYCLTVHCVDMDEDSLPKYNYLFSISETVQTKLTQTLGLHAYLVTNGINIRKIKRKEDFRQPEVFRIVQVSRLSHRHKGQDILLQAAKLLRDEYGVRQFHIDFIGSGESESYLKEMVSGLGLDSQVTFLGNQPKEYIQNRLCDYDLLVQASRWEGFGLTVAEAMAAKVPVVASDVDGLKENLQDGQTGYVFEPDNAKDCARALFSALQASPDTKQKMTDLAYNQVTAKFDIEVTAQKYLDYYDRIVKRQLK